MTNKLEFIGIPEKEAERLSADVSRLLAGNEICFSYGADFMGRPGTKVYSCAQQVVKLRSELRLKEEVARRWCLHTLERERRFAVHHPDKVWFLIASEAGDGNVGIGNICPRLTPLHVLLQAPPSSQKESKNRLEWLTSALAMDCRLTAETGMRLDLGLSNFSLDAEGRLFYLDDDFYTADGFVALAQTLGIYLRNHAWIDEDFAAKLGDAVRKLLLRYIVDPHCLTVLATQMRGVFMPNDHKRAALSSLISQLSSHDAPAKPPHPASRPPKQRYFALLADVHANFPALEAALAFLEKENIRDGIVLGDILGYGPHPVECIERLQDDKLGLALLRGNHDHAAATGWIGQSFGKTSRWCIEWAIPRLSEAHRAWLLALPTSLEEEGWLAVHGAPVDPTFFNAYVYSMTYSQNLDVLEQRGIALCFHGHTHIPGVYARNPVGEDRLVQGKQLALGDYRHCLICPGSVGQPRNREPGAQLAILDWQTRQLTFINLPYALENTVRDMEQAGFPPGLCNRLLVGL